MELSDAYRRLVDDPLNGTFVVTVDGSIDDDISSLCTRSVLHIYPGSWNPLHEGHRAIYDNIRGEAKAVELSIGRWGKEPLDENSLRERVAQFRGYAPVIVTNAARFIEKCAVLKNANPHWHVGVDTILRMRDDYGELGIGGLPGKFHVYDREIDGAPARYPLNFKILPRNVTRAEYQGQPLNLSSTKLRNAGKTFG